MLLTYKLTLKLTFNVIKLNIIICVVQNIYLIVYIYLYLYI